MYFVSIQRLKRELITARQNETSYYPYVLAPIACTAIVDAVRFFFHFPYHHFAGAGPLEAFIVLAGTVAAFWANGGRAGLHFLRRYFSIWWVLAVRFCIFSIPLFVLWALWLRDAILGTFFAWPIMGADRQSEIFGAADAGMAIVIETAFFWRLSVHIRDMYWRTVRSSAVEQGAN